MNDYRFRLRHGARGDFQPGAESTAFQAVVVQELLGSDAGDRGRTNGVNRPDSPSARITVARRSPRDVQQRQMIVSIDGRTVATLLYGEQVTEEVEPGPHRLRVHNTLVWKTIDLDLAPGEHARFTTINRATWGTYAMVSLLGAGPMYVVLTRD